MRRSAALTRLPLMAMAMTALLAALAGGLVRIGWAVPGVPPVLAGLHGPLLVSGFLGTLIGVERGIAFGGLAYVPPLLTGAGALALLVTAPRGGGAVLLTLGSAGLLALMGRLAWRTPEVFLVTMTLGVGAWLAGNVLWLSGWPIDRVVLLWAGFLVLVIAGERQELTRLVARPRASRHAFLVGIGALVVALVVGTIAPETGTRLVGAALVTIAAWLARYDVARSTIADTGLRRFMAAALLSGYAWLAAGGLLAIRFGAVVAGPHYDAVLHAIFLGFVFAMIFAHAPVIFPSVLDRPVVYRASFWIHLALLQLGLALRVAGDLLPSFAMRRWGGLLNVAVVLVFFANTLSAALAPRRA